MNSKSTTQSAILTRPTRPCLVPYAQPMPGSGWKQAMLTSSSAVVIKLCMCDTAGFRGGRAGGAGAGGCTQFVNGCSRMTIDPRISALPGRRTSGFHQPGRHCLHQARRAVRCSASRTKGGLHPSKNRSYDRLRHPVPTSCLWMTAPISHFVFCCGHFRNHFRNSNGYYYVTASWVPYHIHTT